MIVTLVLFGITAWALFVPYCCSWLCVSYPFVLINVANIVLIDVANVVAVIPIAANTDVVVLIDVANVVVDVVVLTCVDFVLYLKNFKH